MTQKLIQNSTNTVDFTLSESTTLTASSVYYLFKLVSTETRDEILFTASDISTNTLRYNRFNITLTGSNTNYTAGTITLNPDGEYFYYVYEMLDPSNLFLSGTSGTIIENGIINVTGSTSSYITNSYTGQSTTFNYYTP
jgi:hypothetical protein